ncbi:invasion associated locus B family protein [Roseitranquillus sediminis]|uniref:invasion associated locus B family protein n=1 Tax=Roseitranquillus sediminis TaxID=2809051 RepID=UPI001D0C0D46|nr:invasion associated locus B family protein [Roseitranquillus sediminis]MBM9595915.1 invasion associated locus B family protein [Roseitranquillus sediminis]
MASRLRASVFGAAFAFLSAPHTASALETVERVEIHRDWTLGCPGAGDPCILSTTTFAGDRTWLATLRLQPAQRADAAAEVQLLVPLQVHLASGIFVKVPGAETSAGRFVRCVEGACEARLALDASALAAWKRAREARLVYRPRAQGPPIAFDVSLMGLTAGLEAMAQ